MRVVKFDWYLYWLHLTVEHCGLCLPIRIMLRLWVRIQLYCMIEGSGRGRIDKNGPGVDVGWAHVWLLWNLTAWDWEPDRRSTFFGPLAHRCAVIYGSIHEISVDVTYNNHFFFLCTMYWLIGKSNKIYFYNFMRNRDTKIYACENVNICTNWHRRAIG